MKTIRKSVFETNSSSLHAISICKNSTFKPFHSKPVQIKLGRFAWEDAIYFDAGSKLSYLFSGILGSFPFYKDTIYYTVSIEEYNKFLKTPNHKSLTEYVIEDILFKDAINILKPYISQFEFHIPAAIRFKVKRAPSEGKVNISLTKKSEDILYEICSIDHNLNLESYRYLIEHPECLIKWVLDEDESCLLTTNDNGGVYFNDSDPEYGNKTAYEFYSNKTKYFRLDGNNN